MARKPPLSYASVELAPSAQALPPQKVAPPAEPEALAMPPLNKRGRPPSGQTLKEASAPVMLYLHPAGAKALKRYALDADTKVHTLLLDAVEAWFKSHGLREPVRITHEEQKED